MSINLSQGKPLKYYSSDRIAQLIGNGILTFIDINTKLKNIFNDNEVVFYRNISDLSKKINIYKKNNKKRILISKRGRIKYHRYMNSEIIAKYIIEKTFGNKSKNKYIWE